MDRDNQNVRNLKEDYLNDNRTSLLKIDIPVGKLKFFITSLILLFLQLFAIGLYLALYFYFKSPEAFIILTVIFGFSFGIPLIYFNFVNYTKRLWDIIGNYKPALYTAIGIFLFFAISIFIPFSIVIILGIYLIMIFTHGKLVKKND